MTNAEKAAFKYLWKRTSVHTKINIRGAAAAISSLAKAIKEEEV